MSNLLLSLALLLTLTKAWFVTNTGFTTKLDDIYYYSPPSSVGKIAIPASLVSAIECDGYAAISVISTHGTHFDASSLAAEKTKFSSDDVWTYAFGDVIYLQHAGNGSVSSDVYSSGAVILGNGTSIPNGPYLVSSTGLLYEVHRLYSDIQGAFTESVTTNADGSFSVLPAGVPGQSLTIAVPSRLYFTKTEDKPLAGVRLGVKDIYDVKGLRTSNGNRAWYHLYPEANKTGPAIQNLIDAGAVIVGKMKTSQFANGEQATADWVDYHSPFNPRGDGYQDTSSSSAGAGSGAGAYEWLDLTIGSDTGGSIRGPSQVQGLYGNRPSHGLVSLDNVMPLSPQLDTAGFLARDPFILSAASKALYGDNITFTSTYPSEILTVGFPEEAESDGDQVLLDFVSKLSSFLSATTSTYNLSADWSDSGTSEAPLSELLYTTYAVLISKEQTRLVRDPFYSDYAAKHDGRLPFVNPVPLYRWSYGDNSTETVAEAVANKTLFMDWFSSNVLVPTPETCSDKILLYVGSNANVNYRNRYLSSPSVPLGFSTGRLSVMSEAPDFVIPLGQAEYNSTITDHVEYLPVTVDIMAAKGCDGMLFSLIEDLVNSGIVRASVAGQSSTTGGEILYRRDLVQ